VDGAAQTYRETDASAGGEMEHLSSFNGGKKGGRGRLRKERGKAERTTPELKGGEQCHYARR